MLNSNTASLQDSIWKGLNEQTFRKTIADLEKASGEVPGESRIYSLAEWERRHPAHNVTQRSISLEDEHRLADDMAYIAASRERGKGISAVALEEHFDPPGITVRLAANSSIPAQVPAQLSAIFGLLRARVNREISERACVSSIFQLVVELNRLRIHGRLRSKHAKANDRYQGPISKDSLHEALLTLLPALRKDDRTKDTQMLLSSVCVTYKKLDRNFANKNEELQFLQEAVKSSSAFYSAIVTSPNKKSPFNKRPAAKQKELHSKYVQQVAKIGRYWDLCVFMTKITRRYPDIFKNLRLDLIPLYKSVKVPVPPMQKIEDCYIHAEIQLVVFYGMTPNPKGQMPRVLGVSKSACYLCDLFISLHGQYFISETHGRLYHQWTIPNLAAYSIAQRQQIRIILKKMHQTCSLKVRKARKSRLSRAFPPESTLKLHAALSSIAASTVANLSQLTIRGPTPNAEPRNLPEDSNVDAADNIAEGSRTPVQTVPVASPLPSISEIEEDSYFDRIEEEERRLSLDGQDGTMVEDLVPLAPSPLPTINGDVVELPFQDRITPRCPWPIEIQGIRMLFEIEEPKQGRITIRKGSGLSNKVDIDTSTPDTIFDFYREEGGSSLQLNLGGKIRETISIDLEWLSA